MDYDDFETQYADQLEALRELEGRLILFCF